MSGLAALDGRQQQGVAHFAVDERFGFDLRGLVPAPITPFTREGDVDHAAIQRLGSWLGSFEQAYAKLGVHTRTAAVAKLRQVRA